MSCVKYDMFSTNICEIQESGVVIIISASDPVGGGGAYCGYTL